MPADLEVSVRPHVTQSTRRRSVGIQLLGRAFDAPRGAAQLAASLLVPQTDVHVASHLALPRSIFTLVQNCSATDRPDVLRCYVAQDPELRDPDSPARPRTSRLSIDSVGQQSETPDPLPPPRVAPPATQVRPRTRARARPSRGGSAASDQSSVRHAIQSLRLDPGATTSQEPPQEPVSDVPPTLTPEQPEPTRPRRLVRVKARRRRKEPGALRSLRSAPRRASAVPRRSI